MGLQERRKKSSASDSYLTQIFNESKPKGITLAAVGGYGRGELSPGSDLDLLIIHDGKFENLNEFVNSLLYPIWDNQSPDLVPRSVDHSVRTRNQTKEASADLKVALGLLDIRFICGDKELFDLVQNDAITEWRKNRLEELRLSMQERHKRFGDLAYLLEPDLKESRGGLRDINALRAIAKSDLVSIDLSTLNQMEEILLDIRDSLHRVSGRGKDVLLFQEQDKVAADLNYFDADALMGQVATIARSVDYQLNVAWHKFDNRKVRSLFRKPRATSVAKNVSVDNHEVVIDAIDPNVGQRAAATAAQLGLPLSIDACAELSALKMPTPWPREAREDLVAFIGGGSSIERVWEALDQAGVIENWFPEWATVRSLPQRNALHRHTVDRHMVETAIYAAKLTRTVHRPDLLLVGALFHDIGKGTDEDHSLRGEHLIVPIAKRIGFSQEDIETLQFLIKHHLLLSSVATRRDLDDPATIQSVIELVPDLQHLELLHALSIADGEATGKAAWSEWKARLVRDLVYRVRSAMKGTIIAPQMEVTEAQLELAGKSQLSLNITEREGSFAIEIVAPDSTGLFSIVAGVLNLAKFNIRSAKTKTIGNSAVMKWLVNLDPYAQLPSSEKLYEDLSSALKNPEKIKERIDAKSHAYAPLPGVPVPPPEVAVFSESSEATIFEIRSHDAPALLFKIGAALKSANVDIKSAIISTLGAEAIDTLYVTEVSGEALSSDRSAEVAEKLREAIH